MITNPEDYLALLEQIQNSQSYFKTGDVVFAPYKTYYKQIVVPGEENVPDVYNGKYDYVVRDDYEVGENIEEWALKKLDPEQGGSRDANITLYEKLGINTLNA